MIRGLCKYGATFVNFNLGPGYDSIGAVIARFQAHVDAMEAVQPAEIAWKLALQEEARPEAEVTALAIRAASYLSAAFGPRASELREFGLKPRKKTRTNAQTKAAAVEKRHETRKARKTTDPKERKAGSSTGKSGRGEWSVARGNSSTLQHNGLRPRKSVDPYQLP